MKLKVCGMKYEDNMKQVAGLAPDYLGFIFYEKSARSFKGTIPELPESIKKVGVFVDAPIEYILDQIEKHSLQAVQLHGNESPEFCKQLKQLCHSEFNSESTLKEKEMLEQVLHDKEKPVLSSDVEIIKVFSIKNIFDFSVLKPYEDVVDYFLFDTKGKLLGGNGYTFNWNVLKKYPSTKPYFLSGGIGLDQLESVLAFLRRPESKYCNAIDVNSKFEIEAGLKNIEKLEKFKSQIKTTSYSD